MQLPFWFFAFVSNAKSFTIAVLVFTFTYNAKCSSIAFVSFLRFPVTQNALKLPFFFFFSFFILSVPSDGLTKAVFLYFNYFWFMCVWPISDLITWYALCFQAFQKKNSNGGFKQDCVEFCFPNTKNIISPLPQCLWSPNLVGIGTCYEGLLLMKSHGFARYHDQQNYYILTIRVPMATKLDGMVTFGGMVTCLEGFLTIIHSML